MPTATHLARVLKALKLADTLDAAQIASSAAAGMTVPEWSMLARAARTHIPSEQTRTMAMEFLCAREDARAVFAQSSRQTRSLKHQRKEKYAETKNAAKSL